MTQTNTTVRHELYLTTNGVIKYLATTDAAQREKILRDYKYPDPEGDAQGMYYQPARDAIRKYHQHGNDRTVFEEAITTLENMYGAGEDREQPARSPRVFRTVR